MNEEHSFTHDPKVVTGVKILLTYTLWFYNIYYWIDINRYSVRTSRCSSATFFTWYLQFSYFKKCIIFNLWLSIVFFIQLQQEIIFRASNLENSNTTSYVGLTLPKQLAISRLLMNGPFVFVLNYFKTSTSTWRTNNVEDRSLR